MKFVDEALEEYCIKHTTPLAPVFAELKKATFEETNLPQMQVGVLEGSLLKMLISLIGAKRVLEIGTFTGFSALAMAEAMPDGGKLITCDVDPVATEIAKKYWAKSPHGKKIELRLGPALDTIAALGELDFVFIDADKNNYPNYWDACVPKVRSGGLIIVDNVLWSGRVLNPEDKRDEAIVEVNKKAVNDKRVSCVMLPVRDGVLIARKI
jgi:caffeoyl-CoA O-methyltransferase